MRTRIVAVNCSVQDHFDELQSAAADVSAVVDEIEGGEEKAGEDIIASLPAMESEDHDENSQDAPGNIAIRPVDLAYFAVLEQSPPAGSELDLQFHNSQEAPIALEADEEIHEDYGQRAELGIVLIRGFCSSSDYAQSAVAQQDESVAADEEPAQPVAEHAAEEFSDMEIDSAETDATSEVDRAETDATQLSDSDDESDGDTLPVDEKAGSSDSEDEDEGDEESEAESSEPEHCDDAKNEDAEVESEPVHSEQAGSEQVKAEERIPARAFEVSSDSDDDSRHDSKLPHAKGITALVTSR